MATEQPDGAYTPPGGGGGGSILGKQLFLLVLVCIAGVVVYRLFSSDGGITGFFQDPKQVRLTYVQSDFQPNLDEEATLRILSQPEQYHKEFDQMVYDFNVALLYHIANRMALPDSLKRRLEPEYQKQHDYLKSMYYNDFVALKDTTATMYENWYNDNANQAVQIFNEVAGKYTCFFVTQIMATLIKSNNGAIMAKGKSVDTPCGIALSEGLQPMVERLKKRAEIMDFSASRGLLKEKVRKSIAELATYELRSRLAIDKTLQYKIFGLSVSETDLRVEAISVVKAGFKLDSYFDVTFSPKKGIVYVTLPPPVILSHEVYPRVDKLDVGWLAGINGDEMNRNFNDLRRQFRSDAIENEKVLDKAKMRADTVMQLIMGPMVKSINRNYKLQVRFQDDAQQQQPITDDERRRRGEDAGTPAPQISAPKPVETPKRKTDGFVPK
ncbi:MAG TPA: DUF4230 domain-containing protein [Saprospiraceae bacterium]|nr:DUF4230 domain-containing protein [Saprospiraceae bacterium]HPI08609.1 DUF4230 domain-containing protein [Saprospiraceae bacterium]